MPGGSILRVPRARSTSRSHALAAPSAGARVRPRRDLVRPLRGLRLPGGDHARRRGDPVRHRRPRAGRRRTLDAPLGRSLAPSATILAFSTEDARGDVYNAAEALAYPRRWPEATSPPDLIAHLLAQAPGDPDVALLLEAARILRDRSFRPWSTYIYLGRAKRGAPNASRAAGDAKLNKLFAEWCTSRDFGGVVSVTERSTNGVVSWNVLHEGRTCTEVARSGPVSRRLLRSHAVRYKHARRRLEITTDCLEAVTPLARIFGRALFGGQRATSWTSRPSTSGSSRSLAARRSRLSEVASKVSVSAIGGTWHSGKSHAITPRGRDLFKALARYKIRIEGGRLDLVTLRAKVATKYGDGAPAQCDVALRPPHLCTVSEPELEPLLGDFLDRAKITAPEPRPRDFYSMQLWNGSAASWTEAEGEEGFASLVASGILKANPENRDVTSPEHPHAGPTATAYPLRGTKYLAWSPDATVAPFLVEEKDLVAYALQFGKLGPAIASALGLRSPAAKLDEDGVLSCGRRKLGPTFVLVFLATRPLRPATVERLRDAAGHGHAVIILPEGRKQAHGLREITMPRLAGPWHPVLAEIARVLKLESFIEATALAPSDARFVLHRATERVWLDGTLCGVTERHFRLLEILILHEGQELHTKDIADHVARGRAHEDTTRKQIDSLVAAITKSFKASKRKPPKDLRELIAMPRLGHYVLRAKGYVIWTILRRLVRSKIRPREPAFFRALGPNSGRTPDAKRRSTRSRVRVRSGDSRAHLASDGRVRNGRNHASHGGARGWASRRVKQRGRVMKRVASSAVVSACSQRVNAIGKYLGAKDEIFVNGEQVKATAVAAMYQDALDTRSSAVTARGEYRTSLAARDAAETKRLSADAALQPYVVQRFGVSSTEAHDFGLRAPRKVGGEVGCNEGKGNVAEQGHAERAGHHEQEGEGADQGDADPRGCCGAPSPLGLGHSASNGSVSAGATVDAAPPRRRPSLRPRLPRSRRSHRSRPARTGRPLNGSAHN